MSATSYSRRSDAATTAAGDSTLSIWYPSLLRRSRSASSTSRWSSATRIREGGVGTARGARSPVENSISCVGDPLDVPVAQVDHTAAVGGVRLGMRHLHDCRSLLVQRLEQL